MAEFQMDFDLKTCKSLEFVLYQQGPIVEASTADIITETMSSEENPESSDAEV